jgi:hypothetical protein
VQESTRGFHKSEKPGVSARWKRKRKGKGEEKKKGSEIERLRRKKSGYLPLPTVSIEAEGPKMGLQLGLVSAAWEVVCAAQFDKLLPGHGGTDKQMG